MPTHRSRLLRILSVAFLSFVVAAEAAPMPIKSFRYPYSGRLNKSGKPTNGAYDFSVKVFDSRSGGNEKSTQELTNVLIYEGAFTLFLDGDSSMYNGEPRWIDVSVKEHIEGTAFTKLEPRQEVGFTPYAIWAYTSMLSNFSMASDHLTRLTAFEKPINSFQTCTVTDTEEPVTWGYVVLDDPILNGKDSAFITIQDQYGRGEISWQYRRSDGVLDTLRYVPNLRFFGNDFPLIGCPANRWLLEISYDDRTNGGHSRMVLSNQRIKLLGYVMDKIP